MFDMGNCYEVILADPPWEYDDPCLHRGGALRHYKTMTIDEIKQLPVEKISSLDCVLFIWVTFPKLQEGLDVVKSWGFIYKTCAFVWIKTNKRKDVKQLSFLPEDSFDSFWGMGRWTRSNAEICLLGTRGKPKRASGGVHQIIYAPIRQHSRKPDEAYEKIEKLVDSNLRIELFAREKRSDWDSWGNEVESNINLWVK